MRGQAPFPGKAGPGWHRQEISHEGEPDANGEAPWRRRSGGRHALLFDGRLDNRRELIALLRSDHEPDLSDAALAGLALDRWGEDAPSRLEGAFALADWDADARRLLLTCDATGERTLYFRAYSRHLVFAPRLADLLAHPAVPVTLNEAALARFLADLPLTTGGTFFAGIERLPPAGRLVWQAGRLRQDRYWRLDWSRRIRHADPRNYVDQARELLDRAVAAALPSEGTVVCHLSGGLDSAGVAATAARRLSPDTVHTLTAVPATGAPLPSAGNALLDEWGHAASVAALHPNIAAHRCPAEGLADHEIDPRPLFALRGMPIRNPYNIGWFEATARQARALGARAVLIGNAGNQSLGWDGMYRLHDLARQGSCLELYREMRGLARHGHRRFFSLLRYEALQPLVPARLMALARSALGKGPQGIPYPAVMNPDFLAAHFDDFDQARAELGPPLPSIDATWRRFALERVFQSQSLHWAMEPHRGFAQRDPLANRALIEFCIAIPPELYLRDGVRRAFARQVLADRVSATVLEERRRGVQCADWFHRLSARRRHLIDEVARLESVPRAARILDLKRMKAILADWPADADAAEPRHRDLMRVVAFGVHIGQFIGWADDGAPSG